MATTSATGLMSKTTRVGATTEAAARTEAAADRATAMAMATTAMAATARPAPTRSPSMTKEPAQPKVHDRSPRPWPSFIPFSIPYDTTHPPMRLDLNQSLRPLTPPPLALARWEAVPDSVGHVGVGENFVYPFREPSGDGERYL